MRKKRLTVASAVVLACMAGRSLCAGSPEPKGFRVDRVTRSGNEIRVALELDRPTVQAVTAKDGNTYSFIHLQGCGADNAFGHPALPHFGYTHELPAGTVAEVTVQEQALYELAVPAPVLPHQPPVPKMQGADIPFARDAAAYSRDAFTRAAAGKVVVRRFRKRGRDYVNVTLRPFTYNPSAGKLRGPDKMTLSISCTPALNKAAGPRTGPIYVIDVHLDNREQLQDLIDAGYDISRVLENTARLYVTVEEGRELLAAGYSLDIVSRQPRELPERTSSKELGRYHDYAGVTAFLEACAANYPDLCRLSSLGQSVQGRELWALKITDNPDVEEDEPEVKYVATIHGDEIIGAEMCLYFITLLLYNYETIPRIRELVDETEIWIVPVMNPDGFENGTRANANGIDLNRSFPDGALENIGNVLYGPPMSLAGRQPETARVMEWTAAQSFVLSANFHSGAVLVNYPYDNDGLGSTFSPTPDENLFVFISETYSRYNLPMWNSPTFYHGISNGADWYCITGGMQDWCYRYVSCNDVTIELANMDPPGSMIVDYWLNNRESMVSYFETALMGARGIVTDASTGEPVFAAVKAAGIDHLVFTDPDVGDFHRMLLPGTYDLEFTAPGYEPATVAGVTVGAGAATRVDVSLTPAGPGGGDLVLVNPESMSAGAALYKAQKEAEGFTVHQIEFSTVPRPDDVRNAIRNAYNTSMAEYAVILGDIEQIPTYNSGYNSDLLYALMDPGESWEDYLGKDLIVGRISLESDAELAEYVDKLAAFVAASGTRKSFDMTWISHGYSPSEYDIAEGTHDWVMANCIPPQWGNTLFYRDMGSAGELSAHINNGTDAVTYSGHGGWNTWVRYGYDVGQVAALINALNVPIVFSHACSTSEFGHDECFGEAWLRTTARGIVHIGGSGSTYWGGDDAMERGEYAAMAADYGTTIGEGMDAGLLEVHNQYPSQAQYYYTIYQLLGDPTVLMFGTPGLQIVTASPLPEGVVGMPYVLPLQAAGGDEPYSWSAIGGTIPGGFTFDGNAGLLQGMPGAAGVWRFRVQVTDAAGDTSERDFDLTINATGDCFTEEFTGGSDAFDLTGNAVTFTPNGAGGYGVELTRIGKFPVKPWAGVPLSVADDGSYELALAGGREVELFGQRYGSVFFNANGSVTFTGPDATALESLSAHFGQPRVSACFDDLDPSGATCYVQQLDDRVAVTWPKVPEGGVDARTGGFANAQVELFFDGRIRISYEKMTAADGIVGLSAGFGLPAGFAESDFSAGRRRTSR